MSGFWSGLKRVARSPVQSVARGLGSQWWGLLLPAAAFAGLSGELTQRPQDLSGPLVVDLKLPSEAAIPRAVPVRRIDEASDPVWRFRYLDTGTEFRAGIPYWIFRIMPKIFADEFEGQGYEHFGFTAEDSDYYGSRPLPRGMSLSATHLRSSLLKVSFTLQRVSINCSGCHRGEYVDAQGKRVLQDGMPNHTADLQGFKRFFGSAFQSPKFSTERVLEEIDLALAEEGKPALINRERLLYAGLVELMKKIARPELSAWMGAPPRSDNGPGRIDPFNAVKFEVLHVPDDHTVATLDFPSIWNQSSKLRPWHHYDGNTNDSSARNFGSVIGVGGIPESVNKDSVRKVGEWIDEFPPPKYPFAPPATADVAAGLEIFTRTCAKCHGLYDRSANSVAQLGESLYMHIDAKVGTDTERLKAFDAATASALGDYGANHSRLWQKDSFRAAQGGYLCGPLDGVWARAPYLHNGSVPSIAELLEPPEARVNRFYRGNRHFDEMSFGWVSDKPEDDGRKLFTYDTTLPGNLNTGHAYGTTLSDAEKAQLIAYLKTL